MLSLETYIEYEFAFLDKLTIILTWILFIGTRKIHVFLYSIVSNYLHRGHRKMFLEQPYARNPRVCWWRLPNEMLCLRPCVPRLPTFYSVGNFSHMQWLYCGLKVIKTLLWHLKHQKIDFDLGMETVATPMLNTIGTISITKIQCFFFIMSLLNWGHSQPYFDDGAIT